MRLGPGESREREGGRERGRKEGVDGKKAERERRTIYSEVTKALPDTQALGGWRGSANTAVWTHHRYQYNITRVIYLYL